MSYTTEITKLASAGKLPTTTLIKMAAFQDELSKLAAGDPMEMQRWLQYLLAGIGMSLGLGAVTAGAKIGVKAYDNYSLENAKPEMFEAILQMHPDLRSSRALAEKYFNSLVHFSPVIAKEPMAAGAYIKQAIQMHEVAGGPLPDMVARLTDVSKAHATAKKDGGASALGTMIAHMEKTPEKMVPSFNYGDINL